MDVLGRTLIVVGVVLFVVGVLFTLGPKLPWLGQLPGDITIKWGNFTFYFPLATCLLVSAVLTLLLHLLRR